MRGLPNGAGGRLGWVLDNPVDLIDLHAHQLFGFDDTELLEDPEVCAPLTMVLLHLTERLIDGRRFIYVMTEFWKRLRDPVFSEFANDKQRPFAAKRTGYLRHPVACGRAEQSDLACARGADGYVFFLPTQARTTMIMSTVSS